MRFAQSSVPGASYAAGIKYVSRRFKLYFVCISINMDASFFQLNKVNNIAQILLLEL